MKKSIYLIVCMIAIIASIIVSCDADATKLFTVTVVFDNNKDKALEIPIAQGGDYKITEVVPTKDGFEFDYWLCGDKKYSPGDKITVNSDLVIKAMWKEKTIPPSSSTEDVTVTFICGESKLEQKVKKGSKVSSPTSIIPEEGYIIEWYIGEDKYNFESIINESITLKAKMKVKTLHISLMDGEKKLETIIVDYAKTISPNNPTKEGHDFSTWTTEQGETFDLNTPIKEDITLFAKWNAKKYSVSFISQKEGIDVDSQVIEWGKTATEPSIPRELEDYILVGWMLGENMYSFSSPVKEDITLTARWINKNNYTVVFDFDDGEITPNQVFEVTKDNPYVTTPNAVETIDGKQMKGWFGSNGQEYSLNQSIFINESISFKAKWETKKVYVNFYVNNNIYKSQEIDWGSTIRNIENPERENSTFLYWYYNDNKTYKNMKFDSSMPIKQDNLTLFAMWDPEYYTVSFDPDNGGEKQIKNVSWGQSINPPADPSKGDYKFAGWLDSSTAEECKFPITVKKDYYLKAKWVSEGTTIEGKHVVTLNYNDSSLTNDTFLVDDSSTFNINLQPQHDKKPQGKQLSYWQDENGNQVNADITIDRDRTFTAVWKELEIWVSFYEDPQQNISKQEIVKWGGKLARPEDPIREGYIFGGWTKYEGLNEEFDFNTEIKEQKEYFSLYAIWNPIKLTVTFKDQSSSEDVLVDYGTKIARQVTKRDGYRFLGWYIDGNEKYDLSNPVTRDMTLIVKWDKTEKYKVYFNYVDGSSYATQEVEVGCTVSSAIPEAKGLIFENWYKGESAFNPYIFTSEPFDFSTPVNEDVYLYAKCNVENMDNGEWFVKYLRETIWTEIPIKLTSNHQIQIDVSGKGNYFESGTWKYSNSNGNFKISSTGIMAILTIGPSYYEINNLGESNEFLMGTTSDKELFKIKSERTPEKNSVVGTWNAILGNKEYLFEFGSDKNGYATLKQYSPLDKTICISSTELKSKYDYYDYYGSYVSFVDPMGYKYDLNAKGEYNGTLTYALDADTLIVYGFIYDEVKLIRKR